MNNVFIFRVQVIKFVFQVLLGFIHFLYAFYSWLVDQTLFKQPDPWRNRSIDCYGKYKLTKKPNHLVVSVCQEEVFYEHLAKLLAWSLFLDVPVVSFYHNENGNEQWYNIIMFVTIAHGRLICVFYRCSTLPSLGTWQSNVCNYELTLYMINRSKSVEELKIIKS